jgi:superfamily II DNA helicase RecQ
MKDTKIWDKWQQSSLFGWGKSKSVKYWTALGRTLISRKLVQEVKKQMPRQLAANICPTHHFYHQVWKE